MFNTLVIISLIIYTALSQKEKGGDGGKGGGGDGGGGGLGAGNGNGNGNGGDETTTTTTPAPVLAPTFECERHRKAWHQLTDFERNLYINGFIELADNGVIAKFTEEHASESNAGQKHGTAVFLPWHRYMLWELETQFRALGGDYDCYSLPYWDWTWETTRTSNIADFYILNSGLGGIGNPHNEYCVEGGAFGQGNYIPSNCDFNAGECCLVRADCQNDPTTDGICIFPTPAEQMELIIENDVYGTDERATTNNGYRYKLEYDGHGLSHVYIGWRGHLSNIGYSPDDPIFYLLHGFVDYNWALWQDCKDYDLTPSVLVNNQDVYGGVLRPKRIGSRGPSRIDDVMQFDVLPDESWSHLSTSSEEYTPRDMHSIADWGVSYEKGSFWDNGDVDDWCPNINSEWFYDTNRRRIIDQIEETETITKRFNRDTINLLKQQFNWNGANIHKKKRIAKTWAQMSCEFNQMYLNEACIRPRYFDDCSDMIIYEDTGDIDITLDELLSKVTMSSCMTDTRIHFYEWAKESSTLLGLCRGDYDSFCDHDFLNEEEDHACLAQISRLLNINEHDNKIMDENKRNNKDRIVKSWTAAAGADNIDDNSLFNVNKNQIFDKSNGNSLTETQRIVLNSVINGIMIIVIISILASAKFCYIYYFRSMFKIKKINKLNYNKVSDNENDANNNNNNNNNIDDFTSDETDNEEEENANKSDQ